MKLKSTYKIVKEKRFRMFLLSLLVAIIAWSIINLSKEYTKTIEVELLAVNIPKTTIVKNEVSNLKVEVKGSGFTLLNNQLKGLKYKIDMNLFPEQWRWNNSEHQFKEIIPSSLKIISVVPERIQFDIAQLKKKKVKVYPSLKVQPQVGFDISKVEISPTEVTVYGDEHIIDGIDSVFTRNVSFLDIKEPIKGKLALKNDLGVKYDIDSIQYNYTIERFTQGEFIVPIVIKNAPIDKEVTIFPRQITVQFQTPLSRFSTYSANQFQVYVDANELADSKFLKIKVAHSPPGVKNLRLLKQSVTYLLIDK